MILTCPNCGTQYVVKDGAIPPQGRQVRCASCKHSWHQDPEDVAESEVTADSDVAEAAEPADEDETFAEAAMIEPSSGPEAEERAYEEAIIADSVTDGAPPAVVSEEEPAEMTPPPVDDDQFVEAVTAAAAADYGAPPAAEPPPDDDFSPFADRGAIEPRRRSPMLAILVILLLVAAAAAAFWFLAPPELKARIGLADAGATPLTLVTTHMDRQKLESGNELLTVAGRVINPTKRSHTVPPIYAQLKSASGKVIYSWTIAPPAPSLAPGESRSFNSAEVNVPAGGDELTISLGAPRA